MSGVGILRKPKPSEEAEQALRQAEASQSAAIKRRLEAERVSEALRKQREVNNFSALFRGALRDG